MRNEEEERAPQIVCVNCLLFCADLAEASIRQAPRLSFAFIILVDVLVTSSSLSFFFITQFLKSIRYHHRAPSKPKWRANNFSVAIRVRNPSKAISKQPNFRSILARRRRKKKSQKNLSCLSLNSAWSASRTAEKLADTDVTFYLTPINFSEYFTNKQKKAELEWAVIIPSRERASERRDEWKKLYKVSAVDECVGYTDVASADWRLICRSTRWFGLEMCDRRGKGWGLKHWSVFLEWFSDGIVQTDGLIHSKASATVELVTSESTSPIPSTHTPVLPPKSSIPVATPPDFGWLMTRLWPKTWSRLTQSKWSGNPSKSESGAKSLRD